MKQYKHIKTGVIAEQAMTRDYYNTKGDIKDHIHKSFIEDSNDWEEVIQKDYEILSLTIHNTRISNIIGYDIEYIKSLLNDKLTKIHSIKRLSDGEIFTINDNTNYGKLEGFDNSNNLLTIKVFGDTSLGRYSLKIIQKAKQPLFTTEDGIEIFEGDKYYEVNKNSFSISYYFGVYGAIKDNNYFRFSTKEAAEEYIIMNKPCLSLNDIEKYKFVKYEELDFYYNWINKLKELVKTKLNK